MRSADFIKVMQTGGIQTSADPSVPSDQREALHAQFRMQELTVVAETAHQARKLITAHAHGGPSAGWLVEAGFDAVQHGTFFTQEDLERMAERGTFLVATTGYLNPAPGTPRQRCLLSRLRTAGERWTRVARCIAWRAS